MKILEKRILFVYLFILHDKLVLHIGFDVKKIYLDFLKAIVVYEFKNLIIIKIFDFALHKIECKVVDLKIKKI